MLRLVWPRTTVSVLLAAVLGCRSAGSTDLDEAQLRVHTDKSVYSLSRDQAATPRIVNQGLDRIYAPMNEYVYVEDSTPLGWANRRPWFAVDGIGVSFPIEPGDSLVALPMNFGYVAHALGVYRFVFEVAYDSLGTHLVPEEQRVSASFELQR